MTPLMMVWPLTPQIGTPVEANEGDETSPPNREEVGNGAANPTIEVDEFPNAPLVLLFRVIGRDTLPCVVERTRANVVVDTLPEKVKYTL